MDPDIAPIVAIERGYLETLLRHCQLSSSDAPVSAPLPDDPLVISQADHATLQQTAKRYANLCQNLLVAGVLEEQIELLSKDDAATKAAPDRDDFQSASAQQPTPLQDHRRISSVNHNPLPKPSGGPGRPLLGHAGYAQNKVAGSPGFSRRQQDWAEDEDAHDGDLDGPGKPAHLPNVVRPLYERQCMRTVQLLNLADGVTHADITNAVRGGMLLDVYLRTHDRSAAVSFLRSADADAFMRHCRRHDLYIRQKRAEVCWNDRQFSLPGHVASKIGSGATRNLIVRRCDPAFTEESLRTDLDHIHNLVVVKIAFIGGSCYISTNSVHNAMFARTCMMSRLKYKGSRIDWDVDECAQPLERIQPPSSKKKGPIPPKKKNVNPITNRFRLLDIGGEDEEDSVEYGPHQ